MKKIRLLIVGGGFAGVKTARELANNKAFKIRMMSDEDSLYYYPALYRSATGHKLTGSDIPVKKAIGYAHGKAGKVHFIRDKAVKIDTKAHTVIGSSGATYQYDKAVFALGAVTSYFGIAGLKEFAFEMKTPDKAKILRQHLHDVLTKSPDAERDFVVIGGGPTGVELAAALIRYIREIAKVHGLKRHALRVHIVEADSTILARLNKKSIRLVTKRLKKLGVHIMTNKRVESQTAEGLMINGKLLKSKTVIWTAGVANNPFFTAPGNVDQFTINKRGRVVVDSHLEAAPDVFVIGDNAATEFAGLAQTAISDARYIAKYLSRLVRDKRTRAYIQPEPITSIPVGERWAIFQWGSLSFGGWPGYIIREIADLIGYMDVLPPRKALKIWLSSDDRENECKICHKDESRPTKSKSGS